MRALLDKISASVRRRLVVRSPIRQDELRDMLFCPICGSGLHDQALLDPNLKGYSCDQGHVVYTTLDEQFGGVPTADTVRPAQGGRNDLEVLKFWLTDPKARRRVPNNLALVCRRMIEMLENRHRAIKLENPFAFCPKCRNPLVPFDSPDLYMQGLRCTLNHEFWLRGRTIFFKENDVNQNFSAEFDDDYLPELIEYWTSDSKWVQPYVHPQLREILTRFEPPSQ